MIIIIYIHLTLTTSLWSCNTRYQHESNFFRSETAIGVNIGSQSNPNTDYVHAIHRVGNKIVNRYLKPWLWNDMIYFNLTANGREDKRDLKVLHDFTMKVIQERKRITVANPEKHLAQQQESLRLLPPVPYIARVAAEDIHLEQYTVPKDSAHFIFISLQRDPAIFAEPDSFIPERFLDGTMHYVKNAFSYVPFSAGPRNCIGQKFALQEEKIILATVLRHFRLQSAKQLNDIRIGPEITLRPKEPIDIRFFSRN